MRQFTRRAWSRLVAGLLIPAASCSESFAQRATAEDAGVDLADLQNRLEFGLRARLPREYRFLRKVVALVKLERIPVELVLSTYHWARKKQPHPFPYFVRALQIRAAELGIRL